MIHQSVKFLTRMAFVFVLVCALIGAMGVKFFSSSAVAADDSSKSKKKFTVGIVYDRGTKFDKSFNEAAYRGVKKFQDETKSTLLEFQTTSDAQSEQFIRQLARKDADVIVVVGSVQAFAVKKVAEEFKDKKFVMIDSVIDLPNVKSVMFRQHEGSFLVGALAAMKSQSSKVGFVGGMDIPLIRRFSCGYSQGAKYIKPEITVFENMIGSTPAAFADPVKAAEIVNSQVDRGADVIYTTGGKSGVGALQAITDRNKLAIATDSNQNYLHPGHVLTSMVLKIDVATYDASKQAFDGSWKSGLIEYGLKEHGVGWSLDEHNKSLIDDAMKAKLAEIEKGIMSGSIKVIDYLTANKCAV